MTKVRVYAQGMKTKVVLWLDTRQEGEWYRRYWTRRRDVVRIYISTYHQVVTEGKPRPGY